MNDVTITAESIETLPDSPMMLAINWLYSADIQKVKTYSVSRFGRFVNLKAGTFKHKIQCKSGLEARIIADVFSQLMKNKVNNG